MQVGRLAPNGGGGNDGSDHPTDEPGFEIRDLRRKTFFEVRDLGSHLREAGRELVRGDVVALFDTVADRLGDDFGLVARATPPAASCWATASVSSIWSW